MASSFRCSPDPVVSALRIIGDFTHYGRRLARGLRSDDDARGRVGDLRNALTLARDHEAPSKARPLTVLSRFSSLRLRFLGQLAATSFAGRTSKRS